MEQIEEATLCKTKAGKGYKMVVNGVWLYCSKEALENVVKQGTNCRFQRHPNSRNEQ